MTIVPVDVELTQTALEQERQLDLRFRQQWSRPEDYPACPAGLTPTPALRGDAPAALQRPRRQQPFRPSVASRAGSQPSMGRVSSPLGYVLGLHGGLGVRAIRAAIRNAKDSGPSMPPED